MANSIIRLVHKYPTRKLAEDTSSWMPGGPWKAKERDRNWYLECRIEPHRAHRVLELLRADSRAMRFELIEAPPPESAEGDTL